MAPNRPGTVIRPAHRVVNVDVDIDSADEMPPKSAAVHELVSLEILDDDARGSDPYNHTGSHCIVTIDDD